MQRVVVAPAAEEDIVKILAWSHEHFGEQARLRYEALLTQAIVDIAENPDRVGSMSREELTAGARTYHLWHSRQRIAKTIGMIGKPRHFFVSASQAVGAWARQIAGPLALEAREADGMRMPPSSTRGWLPSL